MGKKGGSKPTNVTTTFMGRETALECQNICQRLPYCEAFVFRSKTKSCNVKKFDMGRDELITAAGKIFGPKYCPGNITIYICIILKVYNTVFYIIKLIYLNIKFYIQSYINISGNFRAHRVIYYSSDTGHARRYLYCYESVPNIKYGNLTISML